MSVGDSDEVDPEREVRRLHLMLTDWYNGIRDHIDPIESALAADFTSVGPAGEIRDQAESLRGWQDRRDAYRPSSPPVDIELEDLEIQRTIYGIHQLTYRKRVRIDGDWDEYACTLWLRETDRVTTGLQWLHLSETPVAEPSDPDAENAADADR